MHTCYGLVVGLGLVRSVLFVMNLGEKCHNFGRCWLAHGSGVFLLCLSLTGIEYLVLQMQERLKAGQSFGEYFESQRRRVSSFCCHWRTDRESVVQLVPLLTRCDC